MSQGIVVYEALLANQQSLARVQSARRAIEQVGGRIQVDSEPDSPVHIVTLWLPSPYHPEVILPGLPFYPV